MSYKSVVVDYSPKAKKMAAAVEAKANEMEQLGYELVTMAVTGSAKAILIFKTDAPNEAEIEIVTNEDADDGQD